MATDQDTNRFMLSEDLLTPMALPVLHQQRLYIISSISRTQIIMDGVSAKLAECERQLSSTQNLPRSVKKKLYHTKRRTQNTLGNCRNEQQALFQNLKHCQDRILQLQQYVLQQEATAQAAWANFPSMPPAETWVHSWYPMPNEHGSIAWHAPAMSTLYPYIDAETRPEDFWYAPGQSFSYDSSAQDNTTVDPSQLWLDPLDAGTMAGGPGPTEVVDETGLTHYIYPAEHDGEDDSAASHQTPPSLFTGFRRSYDITAARLGHRRTDTVLSPTSVEPAEGEQGTEGQQQQDKTQKHAAMHARQENHDPISHSSHECGEQNQEDQAPRRRYSAAAVDLIVNRLKQNVGKPKRKRRWGSDESQESGQSWVGWESQKMDLS